MFASLLDYHRRVFLCNVKLLVEQQIRGLMVDQEALKQCHEEMLRRITRAMHSFLNCPLIAHHIAEYNGAVRDAWMRSQPPTHTKAGEESKRWAAWRDREAKVMKEKGFNPNSKKQLRWIFFDCLGMKPVLYTETGLPEVSRKTLPAFGEPGKLLGAYNKLVKRRGYVERMIERTARDGILHPQFNTVGTVTLRLGGSGKLNLSQMPKVADFLLALKARPGMKLIQADAEALEPTVLAEFSQDKTLMALYGPNAKPNDIYLYVSAKIPSLGVEIRKYYDPDNPTPASIALAKKHCKKDRAIAKILVLSAAYLAGPETIHLSLSLAGIEISLNEVKKIHRDYWRLFRGVKDFEGTLKDIWTSNIRDPKIVPASWIPSVLGTPICVPSAPKQFKDIVNRFCQTSGHQILQLWIYHIDRLRTERKVEMYPWFVDQHDETIWEAPDAHVAAAEQILKDALDAANAELDMGIKIKAPPMIASNLAEIKDPDGYKEILEQRMAA